MHEILGNTMITIGVPAYGLAALVAGIWFGRRSAKDALESARRSASAAATYWARAESARTYVKAIETPTMQVDVTELRRAHASPVERARAVVTVIGERVRDAVTPERNPADWAEGEMTATFRRIMDAEQWEQPDALTQPVNPSPWVSPIAAGPAPAPSAPPAIVHAPRGPQTPPRWQDGGTPPPRSRARTTIQSLAPRERGWTRYLATPELPPFPEPFQIRMPRQRVRPTPAMLAKLPADPTREFRTRTVEA